MSSARAFHRRIFLKKKRGFDKSFSLKTNKQNTYVNLTKKTNSKPTAVLSTKAIYFFCLITEEEEEKGNL